MFRVIGVALCLCAWMTIAAETDAVAEENVLEEIVVTAQKKPQTLQDVPISVTSLSEETLDTIFAAGDDILALANRVPGLYAESSNGRGAPRFYIRGLGNVDFDLAASQPVAVVMDDVVMENVTLKSFPLFDLEQAEVIRGPQGTLFGRNTTAGIVKFDTKKPTMARDGYLNVMGGQLDSWTVEGALGGTFIEDSMAVRVSILANNRDNWVGNGITLEQDVMGEYRDNAYRIQALLKFSEEWSMLLGYQDRSLDGSASFFRANAFTTGESGLNEFYEREWVFYDDGDNNPQRIDIDMTSVRINFEGDISFTSVTAVQNAEYASKGDIDGGFPGGPGFIPFQAVTEDQSEVKQITQEFRINGTQGAVDWHLGAFFFDSVLDVTTIDGFFGSTTVNHANSSWASFAQLAWHASEKLTLSAGLRYTDDTKELLVESQNVDSFALFIGAAAIQNYDPVEVEDSQTSWETSLNYRMTDDVSLFARAAKGFRAQSIQARDIAFEGLPSVADSETITSFEVGYKAYWFDNRARFNITAFHYEVDDLQLSAIGGANNGNSLLNADAGTGTGIELDFEWLVTDNLTINLGYGYADTEIDDPGLETAICGSGACTVRDPVREVRDPVTDALLQTLASIDGNPFQAAPKTTVNFSLDYSYPLDSGELYFRTDWAMQGETQMALYDAVEFQTDDQYEGGVRIGYINYQKGFELSLFGRNITNEDNIKGFIDFNNNTGFVNEPRIWGFQIEYKFR
jgi:iron complex outermembrane recepter protein